MKLDLPDGCEVTVIDTDFENRAAVLVHAVRAVWPELVGFTQRSVWIVDRHLDHRSYQTIAAIGHAADQVVTSRVKVGLDATIAANVSQVGTDDVRPFRKFKLLRGKYQAETGWNLLQSVPSKSPSP